MPLRTRYRGAPYPWHSLASSRRSPGRAVPSKPVSWSHGVASLLTATRHLREVVPPVWERKHVSTHVCSSQGGPYFINL